VRESRSLLRSSALLKNMEQVYDGTGDLRKQLLVANLKKPEDQLFHPGLAAVLLGAVGYIVVLTYAFAFAGIVCIGDLESMVGMAFSLGILASVGANAGALLFSQVRPVLSVVDPVTGFFFVQMLPNLQKDLAWQLNYDGGGLKVHNDVLQGHMIITIAVYTVLTGLVLSICSRLGMTQFMQFMPFQVTGGYLVGVGLLLCSGGTSLASGIAGPRTLFAAVKEAVVLGAPTTSLIQLAVLCGLVTAMKVLDQRIGKKIPVVPCTIFASCLGFHGMRWCLSLNFDELFAQRWLTSSMKSTSVGPVQTLKTAFDTVLDPSFCPLAIFSSNNIIVWVSMLMIVGLDWNFGIQYFAKSVFKGKKFDHATEYFCQGIVNLMGGLCCGAPTGYFMCMLCWPNSLASHPGAAPLLHLCC